MTQVDHDAQVTQAPESCLSRVALVTSVAAAAISVLLACGLLGLSLGWDSRFLGGRLPDDFDAFVVMAWFALCVAGIVLGFVQLARPRQRPGRPFAAIAIGALSLLVVSDFAVGAFFGWSPSHRSDEAMISSFKEHRQEYAELLRMFQENKKLERVGDLAGDVPNPQSVGVTGPEMKRYRSLMEQLGVESVERYFGTILLIKSTEGLAVSGSMKGYVYAKKPPSPLVGDTERDADGTGGEVYRHIEGDWYLIYEWET